MAKGGSSTKQTSSIELPPWVNQAAQTNYGLAKKIAGLPLAQYQGPMVANMSNMTKDAFRLLNKNVGATDPLYKSAYGVLGNAADMFRSAGSKTWGVGKYLNPYRNEVESRAIANAERSADLAQMEIADKARAARSFGGSKYAQQAAIQGAESTRSIGDLSAQLRAAGYDKATSDLLAHRAAQTQAGSGLVSTAGGILSTAAGREAATAKDVAGLAAAGQTEQAYNQAKIDADMKKFFERRGYPTDRLNILMSALGMSPYGKTETTTATQSSSMNPMMMGLGILSMLGGGGGIGSIFSDRRAKTDIKKLGKDPATGLPLYAYRYRGDPKSYPKVVGPMAQDIERADRGAVTRVGGHKVVRRLPRAPGGNTYQAPVDPRSLELHMGPRGARPRNEKGFLEPYFEDLNPADRIQEARRRMRRVRGVLA